MTNTETLLETMEQAILSIKTHKDTVISIIKNLQAEYDKKKKELFDIKMQLPEIFTYVKQLQTLDSKLRSELATASSDFSPEGHNHLEILFEQASATHLQLLKAEDTEHYYVRRRNDLELELKHHQLYIEQAESMAQQLMISLSYLQTGVTHLTDNLTSKISDQAHTALLHYAALFKCIEDEKLRIGRDLHDGPVQRIASAQMRIDFCKKVCESDLEKGLIVLDQLKGDLSLTLSEIREILFDLSPAPLEKLSLKGSIEHILYNILDDERIHIDFSYNLDNLNITQPLQATIYRIIQELVTNIKKHAKATCIKISISCSNNFIYIYVEDNGAGFHIPTDFEIFRSQNKSYGLANIKTRISELNGKLKITSHVNQGSTFKIQLPVLSL